MKTKLLLPAAIVVAIAALIFGYLQMSQEKAADAAADLPIRAVSSAQSGPNGETIIQLDAKTQELIGMQTTPLTATTLPPEIKAYGRVLDPAPLAALMSEFVSARAALEASGKEYKRLTILAQDQNVSTRALEDAQAAWQHDQAALTAAEAQLTASLGNDTATRTELTALMASLVKMESALVRLDVPAGEWLGQTPIGARVLPPADGQPIAAQFLARAATADPQVQGAGFLFVATNSSARLTAGLAVSGFLQMPGEPLSGVVVPDSAVVRSHERAWVYVQTSDTDFVRREITLDHPVTDGWFVTSSIAPGDKVAVTGAQMLLSEERKSQVKLED